MTECGQTMKRLLLVLLWTPVTALANGCFLVADTYYQQLYCEIKAAGQGAGLPTLADFRRNNEQMQALLLKPYAVRAGIEIKMPVRHRPTTTSDTPRKASVAAAPQTVSPCRASGLMLECGDSSFQLVVNQPNALLEPGVLAADFAMNLPSYKGSVEDVAALQAYLLHSYEHYLRRMMAIGLGGSTLSYAKYAYLFNDLYDRGVSFSARFEKMFSYLKADKKTLQAPRRTQLPREFDPQYCIAVGALMVCQVGLVNLVFE